MPACGVTPEAIPNAIASGSATNPTVTPAIRSDVKSCRVYPARKHKTDFGIHFLFSDVTVFLLERSNGEVLTGSLFGTSFTRPFGQDFVDTRQRDTGRPLGPLRRSLSS